MFKSNPVIEWYKATSKCATACNEIRAISELICEGLTDSEKITVRNRTNAIIDVKWDIHRKLNTHLFYEVHGKLPADDFWM